MKNSRSRSSGLLKLQAIVLTLLTSSCAWQWHEPRPDVTNEVRSLIQQVEQAAAIRDYQRVAELNEQISVIFRREVSEEPFVDLTDHCRQIETKWGRLHEQSTDCLRQLAADALKKGDLDTAMSRYRRVRDLEMTAGRGFSPISINASLQLADLLRRRGELEQPVAILDELLADPFLDPVAQVVARIYLARTHQAAARFELSLLLLDQILAEYPAVWHQDVATFMNLRMERALIYQQQGRLSSAESELETLAFDAFEQLGPVHTTTLLVMNALGQIYERRGKYDLAELALLRALDGMNRTLGRDHSDAAATRNNLAVLYESQGRLQEAEGLYLETLRQLQSQRGATHPDTLAISNNLAYLYMVMQAYTPAERVFKEVVGAWTEQFGPDHPRTLKAANNLGRVLHYSGDHAAAEERLLDTFKRRKTQLGEGHVDTLRSLIDLATLRTDKGEYTEAISMLKDGLVRAEARLGRLHPYTFEFLNQLARAQLGQGDSQSALNLMQTGFDRRTTYLDRMLWVAGEDQRESYLTLHRDEVDHYLSLLAEQDDARWADAILDVSLQRKGLLLKIASEVERISQLSGDPVLQEIGTEITATRREMGQLILSTTGDPIRVVTRLAKLEQRLAKLQAEVSAASRSLSRSFTPVNAGQVLEALPEGSALVDFLLYEQAGEPALVAAVFAKQADAVSRRIVPFADRAGLEVGVQEFRNLIQDFSVDDDELLEAGLIMYEQLWEPLGDELKDVSTVYLVPDGVLNVLPFDAMATPDEEYLLQQYRLRNLTSARSLVLPKTRRSLDGYLVVAGPDYDAEGLMPTDLEAVVTKRLARSRALGLSPTTDLMRGVQFEALPGALEEGNLISSIISDGGFTLQLYSGATAQEKILGDASAPGTLHIATHGFFLAPESGLEQRLVTARRGTALTPPPPMDNPLLRAGLAFAGANRKIPYLGEIDNRNDGILTAFEILGLDLSPTALVVLSACETGLGEIHEGEGVYGLRRSFQEAGAGTVISSLWEISDAGTSVLMEGFYGRLLDGESPADALRNVQLELLDSPAWQHPYIWASFTTVVDSPL